MSSTRSVLQVFEKYQKDRVTFVQTVAELATRPQACSKSRFEVVWWRTVQSCTSLTGSARAQNIEVLQQAGVMALLRPLLLDNVPRCGY